MAKVGDEVGAIASRYRILARLAVGGMAELYLARGTSTAGVDRYCVLKRVIAAYAHDAEIVRMFLDEARLGAQLQHPNIASVYDIGALADALFFTMEYVHGETVRSVVHRAQALGRSLPLTAVLSIIAGAAAGLHHAHGRAAPDGQPLGIVHRDVSPSNLMVSYEGHVKVVDFGVAKTARRTGETQRGTVKGKIAYLSPEQSVGDPVDRRSDLFSLGIVLWEMLTGARLYQRPSDLLTMTAIVHEPPPPPSSRRPELTREVDDLVLRLLAPRAADRFQTAAELIEAIEQLAVRTSAALSSTAIRHLTRELFGERPEPWHALERPRRRLPIALAVHPARATERDLAALPDLRPPPPLGEVTATVSQWATDLAPACCDPIAERQTELASCEPVRATRSAGRSVRHRRLARSAALPGVLLAIWIGAARLTEPAAPAPPSPSLPTTPAPAPAPTPTPIDVTQLIHALFEPVPPRPPAPPPVHRTAPAPVIRRMARPPAPAPDEREPPNPHPALLAQPRIPSEILELPAPAPAPHPAPDPRCQHNLRDCR